MGGTIKGELCFPREGLLVSALMNVSTDRGAFVLFCFFFVDVCFGWSGSGQDLLGFQNGGKKKEKINARTRKKI